MTLKQLIQHYGVNWGGETTPEVWAKLEALPLFITRRSRGRCKDKRPGTAADPGNAPAHQLECLGKRKIRQNRASGKARLLCDSPRPATSREQDMEAVVLVELET